ncbi:MAG: DUF5683 domain-containing protein [Candidatus Zixiibacteriota bacterium]
MKSIVLIIILASITVYAQENEGNSNRAENKGAKKILEDVLDSEETEFPEEGDTLESSKDSIDFTEIETDSLDTDISEKQPSFRPKPKLSALFSGLCPGAGQAYNRKYIKAAFFIAAEATTIYFAMEHHKKAQDAYGLRNVYDEGSSEYNQARADFNESIDDRNLMIWITAGVHLINVLDAYVDAHLAPFPDEVDAEIALLPQRGGAKLQLTLNF